MNCETCRERIAAYQEGLLGEREAHDLRIHWAACPECRAERAAADAVRERLLSCGAAPAGAIIADEVMRRVAGVVPGRRPARRLLRWAVPLAAAAGVAIAGPAILLSTREARGAGLEAMVRKVREANSVAFTITEFVNEAPRNSARFIVLNDRQQRAEFSDGRVIVTDLTQELALVLMPDRMSATRTRMRDGLWNPYPMLVGLARQPSVDLGFEALAGEPTRKVRVDAPPDLAENGPLTVWIGLRDDLPRRVEFADLAGAADAGGGRRRITLAGFEFGAAYDAALFSLEVPAGYALRPPIHDTTVALAHAQSQTRAVLMSLLVYRQEHEGAWPPDLRALVEAGYITEDHLANPRLPDAAVGFLYFRPVVEPSPADALVFEPLMEWGAGGIAGYCDGRVELISDKETYERLLSEARRRAGLE